MISNHYWNLGKDENVPAMDHSQGGWRESEYHPAIGRAILGRMARGETVRSIARDPAMPSYATMYRWRLVAPEFGAAWRELRAQIAAARIARRDEALAARSYWAQLKARSQGKRWWRRGRPSSYTSAAGRAICRRIAAGETMTSINADPKMPSAKVVYTWLRREPAFREMLMAARRDAVGYLEWHAEMTADTAVDCTTWAELRAVEAEAARIRGRAGRITPKIYGRPEA